ncbi:hypothetical protein AAHC03_025548 [Spirometra sp. Aus1]
MSRESRDQSDVPLDRLLTGVPLASTPLPGVCAGHDSGITLQGSGVRHRLPDWSEAVRRQPCSAKQNKARVCVYACGARIASAPLMFPLLTTAPASRPDG